MKMCIRISEKNSKSSNPPYITSKQINKLLGIRPHITRAVPIWIREEKYLSNLKGLLGIEETIVK